MDFVLWQLADSAFPTGGFAHSSGLEAAWQQGAISNRDEFSSFVKAALEQAGRASVPFVNATHASPERLSEIDALCEAFTTNHVANRASRQQGKAFLAAMDRVFPTEADTTKRTLNGSAPEGEERRIPERRKIQFGHLAPVFGACLRRIEVPHSIAVRLFLFNHLRGILAAAVRLNIAGPMEAQVLQRRFSSAAAEIAIEFESATLEDLTQTAPLLEIWQGAQDRLYSRIFQS